MKKIDLTKNLIPVVDKNCTADYSKLSQSYERNGADAVLTDGRGISADDTEVLINELRAAVAKTDIRHYVIFEPKKLEGVKKLIYAGAVKVFIPFSCGKEMINEAAQRFTGKVGILIDYDDDHAAVREDVPESVTDLIVVTDKKDNADEVRRSFEGFDLILMYRNADEALCAKVFERGFADAVASPAFSAADFDFYGLKNKLRDKGIAVNLFVSSIPFSEFKLNENGLIPVIVQEYKTGKILMLAYMNREAYEHTLHTGRMTYYSRSRNELWVKGETSGHYQFVKSLDIDCDKDTILAKVDQIGAACHTGNYSCFYTSLAKKDYDDRNPETILTEIMATVADRKANPKEGSYTNYLFDSGIDKILKKVGEEAAEVIIAAKNPDSMETVYEISDLLYHLTVLMAEKDISWNDILNELKERH